MITLAQAAGIGALFGLVVDNFKDRYPKANGGCIGDKCPRLTVELREVLNELGRLLEMNNCVRLWVPLAKTVESLECLQ